MLNRWSILLPTIIFILGDYECKEVPDTVQKIITASVAATNSTNEKLKQGFELIVGTPLKPLEILGVKLEDLFVSGTSFLGNSLEALGQASKVFAEKFQEKEEQFVDCIKTEQFDPIKEIILDISSCITGKTDTVNSIIMNSLIQVNTTYTILKTLTQLPKCENAQCFADYSTDFAKKFGSIGLGLTSVLKDITLGLAAIPATLPVCLSTKPAISPTKVIGALGLGVLKCLEP